MCNNNKLDTDSINRTSSIKTEENTDNVIVSNAAEFTTFEAEKSFNTLPSIKKTTKAEVHRAVTVNSPVHTDTVASYNYYCAPDVLLGEGNKLHLAAWKKTVDDKTIIKNAETYVVRTNGTYQKTKSGPDVIISNTRIEVTEIEHSFILDEKNNYEPICKEIIKGIAHVNTGKKYKWEIPLEKYKSLFIYLTKLHADITYSSKAGDGIDNCLSDAYNDALDRKVPVNLTVDWSGWYALEGHPPAYYIGKRNKTSSLVDVSTINRRDITNSGLRYLSIGRNQGEISVLFLFMHAGFTNFWFKKAGLGWNMCLVVQGQTNAGKTSILETSVDILNDNRKSGLIQLGNSTEAGARRVLNTEFRDTFCCYDDFSNADEKTSRNAHNLVETALRLVGDDAGRVRAGTGMEIIREQANCVLAVTAEENFQLSASSYSRYIRILLERPLKSSETGAVVSEGTLDFAVLSHYKDNPEILRTYFSLYIRFLTEKGYEIVDFIRRQTPIYRQSFNNFQIGRLVDAAVRLKLQADIICQFAMWCGFAEAEAKHWLDLLDSAIEPTVKAQEELFDESTPAQVFMNALVNCFDFGKQLAATEDEYVYSAGLYVGFIDSTEGTYWLNKEIVNAAVQAYIRDEGINFRTSMKNIPQLLCAEGYAKAIVRIKDGREHFTYLPRSRKGTSSQRKGMYVLYASKLKDFYDEE